MIRNYLHLPPGIRLSTDEIDLCWWNSVKSRMFWRENSRMPTSISWPGVGWLYKIYIGQTIHGTGRILASLPNWMVCGHHCKLPLDLLCFQIQWRILSVNRQLKSLMHKPCGGEFLPKAESRTYGDNDGTKQTGVDEEPVSAMKAHGGDRDGKTCRRCRRVCAIFSPWLC